MKCRSVDLSCLEFLLVSERDMFIKFCITPTSLFSSNFKRSFEKTVYSFCREKRRIKADS